MLEGERTLLEILQQREDLPHSAKLHCQGVETSLGVTMCAVETVVTRFRVSCWGEVWEKAAQCSEQTICHHFSVQMSPHSLTCVTASRWDRPYSREVAAFPLVSSLNSANCRAIIAPVGPEVSHPASLCKVYLKWLVKCGLR